jgi:hypothetical protein
MVFLNFAKAHGKQINFLRFRKRNILERRYEGGVKVVAKHGISELSESAWLTNLSIQITFLSNWSRNPSLTFLVLYGLTSQTLRNANLSLNPSCGASKLLYLVSLSCSETRL